eukprot:scaffold1804_cov359-Prasinococcus_capsulatus_cf.AAC.1
MFLQFARHSPKTFPFPAPFRLSLWRALPEATAAPRPMRARAAPPPTWKSGIPRVSEDPPLLSTPRVSPGSRAWRSRRPLPERIERRGRSGAEGCSLGGPVDNPWETWDPLSLGLAKVGIVTEEMLEYVQLPAAGEAENVEGSRVCGTSGQLPDTRCLLSRYYVSIHAPYKK